MDRLTFIFHPPTPQEFKNLRDNAGWGKVTAAQAKAALSASLGGIHIQIDHQVIAMARYVGDGVLNIYIQDVVVTKSLRGQGISKALLKQLFRQLQSNYPADCIIGLMAAKGQDDFYAQFGFIRRPSDVYGAGMIAPLGNLCLS